jgi:hypothetical protein
LHLTGFVALERLAASSFGPRRLAIRRHRAVASTNRQQAVDKRIRGLQYTSDRLWCIDPFSMVWK